MCEGSESGGSTRIKEIKINFCLKSQYLFHSLEDLNTWLSAWESGFIGQLDDTFKISDFYPFLHL